MSTARLTRQRMNRSIPASSPSLTKTSKLVFQILLNRIEIGFRPLIGHIDQHPSNCVFEGRMEQFAGGPVRSPPGPAGASSPTPSKTSRSFSESS